MPYYDIPTQFFNGKNCKAVHDFVTASYFWMFWTNCSSRRDDISITPDKAA